MAAASGWIAAFLIAIVIGFLISEVSVSVDQADDEDYEQESQPARPFQPYLIDTPGD